MIALLAVECLLWLSERFGWLPWHKGYAVLTAVASVGVAMLAMVVWFGVALVFRRRFQFSLRSLLLLVVVVALPFSWLAVEMKEAREQEKTVDWVGLAGGYLLTTKSDASLIGGRTPAAAWLRGLLGDEFFWDVTEVTFDETLLADNAILSNDKLTDADLKQLQGLIQLERLHLGGTRVTDAGLAHLAALTRLKMLDLNRTRITDAGLKHLTGLSDLREVNLWSTSVTDAGIAKLQKSLPNCKITR